MSDSPAVKDLPKLDSTISAEIAKDHKLKPTEVTEKVVLPTAEDVKAEKTHQGLIQGVENFSTDQLKAAKTREPATGLDLMKNEMAHNKSLEGVSSFDKNNLKNVETQEKNPLPNAEVIKQEAEHQAFKDGIEGFDKDKLSKADTIEKNTLPTKEVIEQEKKA